MRVTVLLSVVLSIASLAPCAEAPPKQTGRYVAVFADGRRIEGDEITGWADLPAAPRLGETPLLDPRQPLRWLRNRSLAAWQADRDSSIGYIEFVGGDRLVGSVAGVELSSPGRTGQAPRSLLVRLADVPHKHSRIRREPMRIHHTDVRRVVWGRQPPREFRPKTLFLADGRQVRFTSLQWTRAGVRVLLDSEIRVVALGDLAEVHLGAGDVWDAYCRELAVLAPEGKARLCRFETTAGMILTASDGRSRVRADGDRRKPTIYHVVQPAWTPDAVWLPSETVRTRWQFASHEMPLTRLSPDRVVQQSMTGFPWRWQCNRSVAGGEMVSGGKVAGWGFGVHAHNEMTFTLSPLVTSFRSRVGLDAAAAGGGCARAMVYLDDPKSKPLFRSDVLVGSTTNVDTGELTLRARAPGDGPRKLILIAHAAHDDRPAGADPLDIRDSLDCVDPVLHLDRTMLRAEVARRIPAVMPALTGWAASVPGGTVPVKSHWDETDRSRPKFIPAVCTEGTQLTLSRRAAITPEKRWLKLWVRQVGAPAPVGCIDIRIDGHTVARMPVNRSPSDLPYLLPMATWLGKTVDVQVVYTPGAPGECVQWHALALTANRTNVNWVPLRIVDVASQNGAGLKLQADGTVLGGGWRPVVGRCVDTYTVHALSDLRSITAVRVEALPHPTLPAGGPGIWNGGYTISQFRLSTIPTRRKLLRGRYVRIELPHAKASLALSEVQVFAPPPDDKTLIEALSLPKPPKKFISPRHNPADILAIVKTPPAKRDAAQRIVLRQYLDATGENIALKAAASQSSTLGQFAASLGVNGSVGGEALQTDVQDDPWWQVDLGALRDIDRIVVWNRIELDYTHVLRNFDVVVLDENRREVYRRKDIVDPPMPAVTVFDSDSVDIPLAWASETSNRSSHAWVGKALDASREGWWTAESHQGQAEAAVFALDKPVDVSATGLKIELKQAEDRWYRTLGRFRLLATGDDPPVRVEPVGVIVHPSTGLRDTQTTLSLIASPHALFEDAGDFEPVGRADASKLTLVADDTHAGQRAVRIAPGGTYRLRLDRVLPIRYSPGEGEFRYIRLAIRKYGGGTVTVGLEDIASPARSHLYEAGRGASNDSAARSVWALDLPAEWVVAQQDVRRDFGRLDLAAITISCSEGTHAVLDHIYLARNTKAFESLTDAPSLAETNTKARRTMAKVPLKIGAPAVVALDADGRPGTGVIVGAGGWVVTAGHLIAGVGDKITLRLADGRQVKGRAAGIDRDRDVGLVRIIDKGVYKGVEITQRDLFHTNEMYVGFSLAPSHEAGKKARSYVTLVASIGNRTATMDYSLPDAIIGGPLLDATGKLFAVHNDTVSRRALQFTKAHGITKNWARLTSGESWGNWMLNTGPMMGIHTTPQAGGGARITRIYEGTMAAGVDLDYNDVVLKVEGRPVNDLYEIGRALAEKMPGQSVALEIKRGEEVLQRKVTLMRREDMTRRKGKPRKKPR